MASILSDGNARPERSGLLARLRTGGLARHAAFDYLLLLRFVLFNVCALAVLAVAAANGLVATVLAADTTHIVVLIAAAFVAGLALCARRVWQTSIELNAVRSGFPKRGSRVASYLEQTAGSDGQGRSNIAAALKLKLATRIAPVRHIANGLVMLGLIGTVLGFIIALSGVDPDLAGDVSAVGPMVSKLIEGMAVALYTTLTGAVLSIWLMVNYRLLEGGVVHLLTQIVERGEASHGRA
jgi:biopolymer transport protein ExbB/TolQ